MARKRTSRDDGKPEQAARGQDAKAQGANVPIAPAPQAPGQRPGPDDEPRDAPGRLPATQPPDPVSRQGFDRQRLVPQDERPADVLDDENIAGEKDFELGSSQD